MKAFEVCLSKKHVTQLAKKELLGIRTWELHNLLLGGSE